MLPSGSFIFLYVTLGIMVHFELTILEDTRSPFFTHGNPVFSGAIYLVIEKIFIKVYFY